MDAALITAALAAFAVLWYSLASGKAGAFLRGTTTSTSSLTSAGPFPPMLAEEAPPVQPPTPGIKSDASTPSAWVWKGAYDALIFEITGRYRSASAIIKALIAQESDFNPGAVNPEGASFSAAEIRMRLLNDPDGGVAFVTKYSLNPSIGLMQIRWGIAKKFGATDPETLLDPTSNIQIGFDLLKEMQSQGITLSTIDAWNVGAPRVLAGTLRNLPYRDRVNTFYQQFLADFPPDQTNVGAT